MKTAIITYHSKTGTTQRYAQEIGKYLTEKALTRMWYPSRIVVRRCSMELVMSFLDAGQVGSW